MIELSFRIPARRVKISLWRVRIAAPEIHDETACLEVSQNHHSSCHHRVCARDDLAAIEQ